MLPPLMLPFDMLSPLMLPPDILPPDMLPFCAKTNVLRHITSARTNVSLFFTMICSPRSCKGFGKAQAFYAKSFRESIVYCYTPAVQIYKEGAPFARFISKTMTAMKLCNAISDFNEH